MSTVSGQVVRRPVLMIEEGGRGGVADYTAALSSALAANGQPVELVTAADHLYAASDGVSVHGWIRYVRPTSRFRVTLRRIGAGKILNGLSLAANYPRCVHLARSCRLAHLQGGIWFPAAAAQVAAYRLAGVPVVHTPHNTFGRAGDSDRAMNAVERLASRTIVHTAADLGNLGHPEKAVVIPHGDYNALAAAGRAVDRLAARRELGIGEDATVILLFGQLRDDKGIGDVLAAAAATPQVTVLIAGEDVGGLGDCAGLLDDPRLEDRVILAEGFHPMDAAARFFAAADAVALAYRQASQSGVMMLAYGFSRPVVAYPAGGLTEGVLAGETGWICAEPSVEALAAAFAEVAAVGSEEALRRGRAGARLAADSYSWDAIAKRTIALYEDVDPAR